MPTYLYQTLPHDAATPPRQFEVRQSINEAPLTHDPESGARVERVITGGRGPLTPRTGGTEPTIGNACGPSCGCD